MEALEFQTGTPEVHWEYNTIFIYVIEDKRVTHDIMRKCNIFMGRGCFWKL